MQTRVGRRERKALLGGFATQYQTHYGAAGSMSDLDSSEPNQPQPEEHQRVRFEENKNAVARVTERRQQLRRRMSRSFSRALSATELKEFHAEHSWRTAVFMTTDHMFYSWFAWLYGFALFATTLASCFAFVLSTMDAFTYQPTSCVDPVCVPDTPGAECREPICAPEPFPLLGRIEDVTMIVFVFDYLIRIATVHAVPQRLIYWDGRKVHERAYGEVQPSGCSKTLGYMGHVNQIVDLLVIIPFVFDGFFRGFVQLRLLRVTRVLRVLKLSRYSSGGVLVWRTLKDSGPALSLITIFSIVLSFLVGSLIYYFEMGEFKVTHSHPEGAYYRPAITGGEEVSPFTSAASGAYWVFVTATTVGYGDLYPTSGAGQVIAGVVAMAGVVFLSLPIAIVVKHFNIAFDRTEEEDELEKALIFEEEMAREKDKAAEGNPPQIGDERRARLRAAEAKWRQQHAEKMNALRGFLLDQMRHATPLFDAMFEEFASKHLLQKLERGDRASIATHDHLLPV